MCMPKMQHMTCIGCKVHLYLQLLLINNFKMIEHSLDCVGKDLKYLDVKYTNMFRDTFINSLMKCQKTSLKANSSICTLHASLLDLWQRVSCDPDTAITSWMFNGAPAGILVNTESCNIYQE